MQNKLLIWDFDGVLADTEYLWVNNWADTLRKLKNLDLSQEQCDYYIAGKADKTKVDLFKKDFPDLEFDDEFWTTVKDNESRLIETDLHLTPHVLDILNDKEFSQCVATGATLEKHTKKVVKLNLGKYFDEHNTFTAYLVKDGKPAPDIFLYAAEKMGYKPEDCLVIEDSIVGVTAAKAANIPVIAYIGATGNNSAEYAEKCKKAGAFAVSNDMREVYQIIQKHFAVC